MASAVWGFGFWDNDSELDRLLRAAHDELQPVAEALVSSPATARWWDKLSREDQRYVAPTTGQEGAPPCAGQVVYQVSRAVKRLLSDEAQARRHYRSAEEVPETASGAWGSIPFPGL